MIGVALPFCFKVQNLTVNPVLRVYEGNRLSSKPDNQDEIRKAAEAQLARTQRTQVAPRSPEELLYELQVHQVELEMQNEDLRKSHLALEELRDLYVDLFEFAPVCYIVLDIDALISEINLTGCNLFGVERS